MSEVVKDLNNKRLHIAWRHLLECIEPLYDPELLELHDRVSERSWIACKDKKDDPFWEVPNDVYDYHVKCEETIRYLRELLGMQGLAPTPKRLRKMEKKHKEKKTCK